MNSKIALTRIRIERALNYKTRVNNCFYSIHTFIPAASLFTIADPDTIIATIFMGYLISLPMHGIFTLYTSDKLMNLEDTLVSECEASGSELNYPFEKKQDIWSRPEKKEKD